MSRSSFPRAEHLSLLKNAVAERLRVGRLPVQLSGESLDHYRCCYRLAFDRIDSASSVDAITEAQRELSIHFQIAERLENSGDATEINALLDQFVQRNF